MDERQNAIVIAEMKGNMNAIRAENEAMESRIDTSLTQLHEDARLLVRAGQFDRNCVRANSRRCRTRVQDPHSI